MSKPSFSQYSSSLIAVLQGKTHDQRKPHAGLLVLHLRLTLPEAGGTFTWPMSRSVTANPYVVHVTSAQLGDYRVELFLVKQDELLHNLSRSLTNPNTMVTEDKHTGLNSLPLRAQGDYWFDVLFTAVILIGARTPFNNRLWTWIERMFLYKPKSAKDYEWMYEQLNETNGWMRRASQSSHWTRAFGLFIVFYEKY